MWEVRAAAGRLDELVRWVSARAAVQAQLFRGDAPDLRLVVIDPSGRAARDLAGVPAELVARPPHAWDFDPVERNEPDLPVHLNG